MNWLEISWNHVFVCCHFFSRYWTSMLRCSFCPSRWRAWPPRDGVSPMFSPACCMCCQVMRFVCSSPMLPCQVRTCSGDLGSVLPVWRYRERCFQATYGYLWLLVVDVIVLDAFSMVLVLWQLSVTEAADLSDARARSTCKDGSVTDGCL